MIIKDKIMSAANGAYGDGLDGSSISIVNFTVGKKTCAPGPAADFS